MTDRTIAPGYEHSGPPAYVPLSGGAVTALVLSIVAFFIGFIGPFWIEAVPLLIVLMCWGGISRGVRRGKVVAILAIVFSIVGGGVCYLFQKAASTVMGDAFSPVISGLEKGDRAIVDRWAGAGPERDARVDRWTARAKAAWTAEGAFKGSLEVPFLKWGLAAGLVAQPSYQEEFAPKGDRPPALGATFWFRAPCANGDVYVAFDYGTPEKFSAAMKKARADHPARGADAREVVDTMFAGEVEEIRFFH